MEGPNGESLPLLIKFLFTTEWLSVQVHPNDEYASRHHQSKGKTEMWHILRAEPGAQIALGLRETMTPQELREASESGEIERKLNRIDVHPGETYFVPAGTIHAIGAGIALCEIQQQSDVTYRLYDYGRPRELHLDHGVKVSYRREYVQVPQSADPNCVAESAYFRTDRLEFNGHGTINATREGPCWVIGIEGEDAGKAWQIEAGSDMEIRSSGRSVFLRTLVPAVIQKRL